MKKHMILDLYILKNIVFSNRDIALLWAESDTKLVKKRIYRYLKAGKLYSIRRGFYAKDKNYDRYKLATNIYTLSYVSIEIVLGKAGVIFQHYGQTFVTSYLTREIIADRQRYS